MSRSTIFYAQLTAFLAFAALFPNFLAAQQTLLDSIALTGVVIQATRAGEKTPVPHHNFSGEKIAKFYHAQDVPMLLTSVPSLVENSDAGTGIGYTGLRIRGSDPTRVNVTLNGVPVNDAESQGVFWVNLPDLASSAAEIQVQRGIGTSTNGPGAFGATVNFDLSRIEPERFAVLTNTLGSFGTRKHSLSLGSGLLKNRFAFSGRLSGIRSDGYIDRATANLRSLHLTGGYIDDRQSLQAHLLTGREITYQAWYGVPAQYMDDPTTRRYNPAGTERPGAPYAQEVDHYTQRYHLLFYKRTLAPHWHLQLNGHYTRGFGYYEQYKASERFEDYGLPTWGVSTAPNLETLDLVRRRWLDNHFFGTTFALRWADPDRAMRPSILWGGAASRYLGTHFGDIIWTSQEAVLPDGYRYYDNDASKDDANTYVKLEIEPFHQWSLFADLQYRRVSYTFLGFNQQRENVTQKAQLSFFNPKVGFNWRFAPRWDAYGFFGVGNREPNRDDYTQSSPESRPRPERLYDWEGGVKTSRNRWSATANVYWMQYRDQLVLDGRINDVGAYIRTNVPESYRAGIELEASLQVGRRWHLAANGAWSRNKVAHFTEYRDNWDTGAQEAIEYHNTDLAFSPNFSGRLEVGFDCLPQQAKHALSITLSGKYVSQQYLDNTSNALTALDAFGFADLRLNYDLKKVLGKQISLLFSVNNLLSAQYAPNGWTYRFTSPSYDPRPDDPYTRSEGNGTYHQAGFFPQAGRYWMATLRCAL